MIPEVVADGWFVWTSWHSTWANQTAFKTTHLGPGMIKSDLVRRNSMTYIWTKLWACWLHDRHESWSSFSPIHSVGALRSCNEISGVGDPATLNVTLNAGSHCAGAVYKIQTCLWIVLHFSVRLTVQIIHPLSPYLSWTSHLPFRTVDRVQ